MFEKINPFGKLRVDAEQSRSIKNKSIPLLVGVSIFCLLVVLSVFAWTGPSGTPPDPNAPAPINVSSSGQEKEGQFGIAIPSGESLDGSYGLTVGTASNPLGIKTDGDSFFGQNLSAMGNVGIGTTSPGAKLHVYGDSQGNYGVYDTPIRVEADNYTYLELKGASNQAGVVYNRDGSTGWLTGLNNDGKFRIADLASINQTGLTNAKDGSEGITIDTSGNVGIGTTNPSYKLHVTGDVYADGGWLRTNGPRGWYNETYGGGMRMTDSTWLRTYNNKSIYSGTGIIRSDASVRAPIFYDQNNTSYYVDPAGNSNLNILRIYGHIDANHNAFYGRLHCYNLLIESNGGFENSPYGYCQDARTLGSNWYPIAASCINPANQEGSYTNQCDSSGNDFCVAFDMFKSLTYLCDEASAGDAVVTCCQDNY